MRFIILKYYNGLKGNTTLYIKNEDGNLIQNPELTTNQLEALSKLLILNTTNFKGITDASLIEGEDLIVEDVVAQGVTNKIVANESIDLPKIVRVYAGLASEFNARQDVLEDLKLIKDLYTKVKAKTPNSEGDFKRENAIKQAEAQF